MPAGVDLTAARAAAVSRVWEIVNFRACSGIQEVPLPKIIIEDVDDPDDLYASLMAVFESFGDDPRQFRLPEVTISWRRPIEVEAIRGPARAFAATSEQSREFRSLFVPCPNRGRHERLTDCPLCWAEVQQGQASLVDVLTPEGLDAEVRRLLGRTGDSRDPC